ncbi:MAG: hypothetical protein IJE59_00360 [Clostridia bacterium]|nr:hypothetical protein [Clostridia bacterium]
MTSQYTDIDLKYLITTDDLHAEYPLKAGLGNEEKLEDFYYEIRVSAYQGEKIEIENIGTVYYAGKVYSSYYYRNTLDKLTIDQESLLKYKTKSGYELIQAEKIIICRSEEFSKEYFTDWWASDATNVTEKLEYNNMEITLNCVGSEYTRLEIESYNKEDIIYQKLENKLLEVIANKYDVAHIDIFELCSEYLFGPIELTFDVGTENNGKSYLIGHLKNGLEYEEFTGKVENGKITITVDSLSPFMVSILEEKVGANTNGGTGTTDKEQEKTEVKTETKEEDKTKAPGVLPDTGLEITIVLAIAVMLVAVTVVYNKYRGLKDI